MTSAVSLERPTGPFPLTGGQSAARLREIDWSTHALGEPEHWPVEFRTALRLALTSRFPTMIHWGSQLHSFHNDAFVASLGHGREGWLGRPACDWWSGSWRAMQPTIVKVLAGESHYVEDAPCITGSNGQAANAFFNHSLSPLWNDAGEVCGVYIVAAETTARVTAERHQQSDEHRSRQILDSAIDYAIIAMCPKGLVTQWNEGARRILGWSDREMLGHSAERIFTPEDIAAGRLAAEMQAALIEGRGDDERWHVRKSGERFWGSGEITVLDGDDGEPAGFIKVLHDRTEQHEAETRLEASEARFQMALGAAGLLGSWEWDIAGDRVYADGNFAECFSVSAAEAAGGVPIAAFIAGIHPDDRERVGRSIAAALASCCEYYEEYRLQRKDGSALWIAARGHCICDEAGKPTYFPGVAVEITERRSMENALRASEMRTRQALEAADIGTWEVMPTIGEQQWDARARELLAFDADEEIDLAALQQRVHAEDRQRVSDEIKHALADRRRVLDTQYRVLGRGGGQTWVHVRGHLVSEADETSRFVGTVRDITPQRVAEDRSALLTHELNHRIKNILAVVQSIVSQSLRRSDTPQQASRAIGERLAALGRAHDLLTRTHWVAAPLCSVIEGAAEVYGKDTARLVFDGPEVLLNAKAALAFSMAMHELMTNAMKYGALASEVGHVDVRWRKSTENGVRRLELVWTEAGGPIVAPPLRFGFGVRLMEGLSRDLGGRAHADYREEGLTWTLVADLDMIEEELTISEG